MEVDEPESRSFRAVAGGPHPIVKRMMHLSPMDIDFTLRREMSRRKLKILGLWWKLIARHITEKLLISLS